MRHQFLTKLSFVIVVVVSVLLVLQSSFASCKNGFDWEDASAVGTLDLDLKPISEQVKRALEVQAEQDNIRVKIRQFRDSHLEDFKAVHLLDSGGLSQQRLRRRKRDVSTGPRLQYHGQEAVWVLESVERFANPFASSGNESYIDCRISWYLKQRLGSCLVTDGIATRAVFYQVSDEWEFSEIGDIEANSCKQLLVYKNRGNLYAVTVSDGVFEEDVLVSGGSTVYKIEFRNASSGFKDEALPGRLEFSEIQTIETPQVNFISVREMSAMEAVDTIMFVVPDREIRSIAGSTRAFFSVNIKCYRWQGGYVDFVYSIPAKSPQSVSHASIASRDYIFVANYRDDSGSTRIFSTIWSYNHNEQKFQKVQNIQTYGARDSEFFKFTESDGREEHFLVVANEGSDVIGNIDGGARTHIYKRGTNSFVLFQALPSFGAWKVAIMQHDGKFVMVIMEHGGAMSFYQYTGWKFSKVHQIPFQHRDSEVPFFLHPFRVNQDLFFSCITGNGEQNGLYRIQMQRRNDYEAMSQDLQSWCTKAESTVNPEKVRALVEKVKALPKITDTEIVMESAVEFTSKLEVKSLKTESLIVERSIFDKNSEESLGILEDKLHDLRSKTNQMLNRVNNSLSATESGQQILTPLRFHKWQMKNDVSTLNVINLVAEHFNGQNLNALKRAILYDKDYRMPFVKVDSITTTGERRMNTTQISRKPVTDIVFRKSSGHVVMLGNNSFPRGLKVENSMSASRKWNGIRPSEFVSLMKNQSFREIHVSSGIIRNLDSLILNDVNVSALNEDAILKEETDIIISSQKSFQRLECGNLQVAEVGSHDVNRLLQDAIRLSQFENTSPELPSNVTWNVKLEDLFCDTVFLHNDKINGEYNLEEDFIAVNAVGSPAFVETLELEASETNFGNLRVTKSLNGIPVSPTDNTLAVLQKSTRFAQKMQNTVLDTLIMSQPSEMVGTLNGHNVEQLLGSKVIRLNSTSAAGIFSGSYDVMFTEPVLAEDVSIGDEDLLATLEQLSSANLTMSHTCNPEKIIFEAVVVQGGLKAFAVNGLLDLVLKSDPSAVITAPKEFAGQLTVPEARTSKLMSKSGWDMLLEMDSIILTGNDQTFKSAPAFEDGLKVKRLLAGPANSSLILDGIPLDSIMLANKESQEVNVDTKFSSLVVSGGSQTEKLHVSEWNDRDLDELLADTLRTESESGQQVVTGYYNFKQSLALHDVKTDTINTHEVEDLFLPMVPNNRHAAGLQSTINGTLVLKKSAALSDLFVSTFVNDLDSDHWGVSWLTRGGKQDVTTPFVFHKMTQVTDPEVVDHLVSDVNVRTLNESALRLHEDMDFQRLNIANSTTFPRHFCKEKKGVAGRSLDDFDVDRLPVDKRWDISGPLTSEQEATYQLYKKFIKDASDPDRSVVLRVNGGCSFAREPQEVARLNDVSLGEAVQRFWFADESAIIKSPIELDSATFAHSSVEGLTCGVDLKDFVESYLSKSKNQTWTGQFTFDNELEANKLTVTDTVLLEGECNGFDPEVLMQTCVRQDDEQTINTPLELETLYAPNIKVAIMNDFDWCSEFATVNGTNRITGPKRIQTLSTKQLALPEDIVVNGVDLVEWQKEAVKVSGDFVIHESRNFENATFKHVELETVNGKALDSSEVLLNQGDQKGGNLTVVNPDSEKPTEFSKVQVDNNLNGQKVEVRMGKIVMDNGRTPLYMMGKKFKKKVKAANVTTRARLTEQETEVNQLLRIIENPTKIAHNYSALGEKLGGLLDVFDQYVEVASEHATESKCFNENFKTRIPGLMKVFPVNFESNPSLGALSDGSNGQILSWYSYNMEGHKYSRGEMRQLNLRSKLEDFTLIQRRKHLYFVVSCGTLDGDIVPLPVRFCPGCTNVNLGNLEKETPNRTFVFTVDQQESETVQFAVRHVISGNWLVDSLTITSADTAQRHCLVVAPSGGESMELTSTVYCFLPTNTHSDDDDDGLHHYQDLQIPGPAKHVASISGYSETLLLIATDVLEPTMLPETHKISVWSSQTGSKQFTLQDTLHISNLRSMDGILASNYHYFLAVAMGKTSQIHNSGRVVIYRYSESLRVFQKYQTLQVGDPIQVKFQNLEATSEQLLFVLSDDKLLVYAFKGASQWTLMHTLETSGASSLALNTFEQSQIYASHALVIENDEDVRGFSMQFNGIPHLP